jgi:hypothetical protein
MAKITHHMDFFLTGVGVCIASRKAILARLFPFC